MFCKAICKSCWISEIIIAVFTVVYMLSASMDSSDQIILLGMASCCKLGSTVLPLIGLKIVACWQPLPVINIWEHVQCFFFSWRLCKFSEICQVKICENIAMVYTEVSYTTQPADRFAELACRLKCRMIFESAQLADRSAERFAESA